MDWFYDLKEKLWPSAPIGIASEEAIMSANRTKTTTAIVGFILWIMCNRDIKRFFKKIF